MISGTDDPIRMKHQIKWSVNEAIPKLSLVWRLEVKGQVKNKVKGHKMEFRNAKIILYANQMTYANVWAIGQDVYVSLYGVVISIQAYGFLFPYKEA